MTPLQTALYFREWAKVRKFYTDQGIDPKQADSKRHQLHLKALGVMKSSKAFTNPDFDKILATFRAITQPDNLDAQLHAIEAPEKRLGSLQAQCRQLVGKLPKVAGAADPAAYVSNYLDSVARSLVGVRFADLQEKDAARVLGILNHRLGEHVKKSADNCPW